MIRVLLNDQWLQNTTRFKFPAGEVQSVLVHTNVIFHDVISATIKAVIKSSDDLMELLQITDAIRREHGNIKVNLFMPYLPYARQDRVANEGESLTLKVFCDIINSQNYNTVTIYDCHSDVGLALLNNIVHVTQAEIFNKVRTKFNINRKVVLVSPDVGAAKKTFKIAQQQDMEVVQALKHRDTKTGKITGTTLIECDALQAKHFLIVDDLVDGGATFIELAKELRQAQAERIDLFVTHGVFSKGFTELRKYIDHIYTTDSYFDPSQEYDSNYISCLLLGNT